METQVMWCHATIHQQKKKNWIHKWLTATKRYLPNVLFSFVEFLSQIFSRGLTGDLNHGQLLAIASHVAGGLTHTVIVVFLYQKVCGWSKSFKTISWSQPAHKRTFIGHRSKRDRRDNVFATIVHFPWKQVMTEVKTLRGVEGCGIYWRSAEHGHVTNPPNGIFKQWFYFITLLWSHTEIKTSYRGIMQRAALV